MADGLQAKDGAGRRDLPRSWRNREVCPDCDDMLEIAAERLDWQELRCQGCDERFWRHGTVLERA